MYLLKLFCLLMPSLTAVFAAGPKFITTDDIVDKRNMITKNLMRRVTVGDSPLLGKQSPITRRNCVTKSSKIREKQKTSSNLIESKKILDELVRKSINYKTNLQTTADPSSEETLGSREINPCVKKSFSSNVKALENLSENLLMKKRFNDIQLVKAILFSVINAKEEGFLRVPGSEKHVNTALELYFDNINNGVIMKPIDSWGIELDKGVKASLLKKILATQSSELSFLDAKESATLRRQLFDNSLLSQFNKIFQPTEQAKIKESIRIANILKKSLPLYKKLMLAEFVEGMSKIIKLPGDQLQSHSIFLSYPSFCFPDPTLLDPMTVASWQTQFSSKMSPIFEFPSEFCKELLNK